jgi:alpha-1,2-glucosyltransferase
MHETYLFSGDKSNHVATIHLTQMLYIWPFIAFFSLPLMMAYIIDVTVPRSLLPRFLRFGPKRRIIPPRIQVVIPIISIMIIIVHYNTIVHPFILADNRHYVFYVFNKILLRHRLVKYLAVPVYFICAWAAIATLGPPPRSSKGEKGQPYRSYASENTNVTTVIMWAIATSLSLITAPLVEPRYFILPWLFWRLHVVPREHSASQQVNAISALQLPLERVWFLIINAITGYAFLYKGFTWAQEPGSIQRFMW